LDIIRRYEPWLTWWISEKDHGQSDAINRGWSRSTGELLGWINSDDILLPEALILSARHMVTNPFLGFIYGDLEHVDPQGNPLYVETYKEFRLSEILRDCTWISQPGNLIRRSVLSQIGPLDIQLHFLMDLDLWIRAGFICDFGYLRRPLARFRQHINAKTTNKIYMAAEEVQLIYDRIFSKQDLPPWLSRIRAQSLSSAALYSATTLYSANRLLAALSKLLKAVKRYPVLLFRRKYWSICGRICFALLVGGRESAAFMKARSLIHSFV
jgi:hypothetical protein